MATAQRVLTAVPVGYLPGAFNAVSTQALNATATWLAYSFVPDHGTNMSEASAFVSAITGTPLTTTATCDLFSDTGGQPNASLEGPINAGANPTAGNWTRWTFAGTTALTAGTQYWLVFKTTDASNFPTYRFGSSSMAPIWAASGGSSSQHYGWFKMLSTNSGGAWGTQVSTTGGWRIGYSDGTYAGQPFQNIAASGDLVHSATESGVKFTWPSNATGKVAGIALGGGANTGSPTGNPKFRLYTGSSTTPTLQAETFSIPKANWTNGGWHCAYFSSSFSVSGGTVCRVTLAETSQSDTSSNAFKMFETTWDSDTNSATLMPMDGTAIKTFTSSGASGIGNSDETAFTDTATAVFPFALLLDTTGEFASSGGSGGLLVHPGMVGGCRG